MNTWIEKAAMSSPPYEGWHRLVRWLPKRLAFLLCVIFSRVLYLRSCDLRNRVYANMQTVLRHEAPFQIRRLCRRYFLHQVLMLYEFSADTRNVKRALRRFVRIEGESFLEQALVNGNGAVVFSLHLGNFFFYSWYLSQRYSCIVLMDDFSGRTSPICTLLEHLGLRVVQATDCDRPEMAQRLQTHLQQNGVVLFYADSFEEDLGCDSNLAVKGMMRLLSLFVDSPSGPTIPLVPLCGMRTEGWKHRIVFGPTVTLSTAVWDEVVVSEEDEAAKGDTQEKNTHSRVIRRWTTPLEGARMVLELVEQIIHYEPSQWLNWGR